ncbi:MAG: exodeoxyribonuclease III [Gammaproteobacteria bacterium]|nr:exodeoxyribonuclease III [Gammaproteobacteria bacterium]
MQIASWNVNSLRVRLPQVLTWLEENPVDVLAVQETKTQDPEFPLDEILDAGYRVVFSGQKTYNGVAILAKQKPEDIITDIPQLDDPQRRILAATIAGVRVINLYVVNGSEVASEKYAYKLDWLEKVTAFIEEEMNKHQQVVVLGDFNIAPDERDVHDTKKWNEDVILCSKAERSAYQKLCALGFSDTFRQFEQEDDSFSWWDYRSGGFPRNQGLRIDLILASSALSSVCSFSRIDKIPRAWERPSDHAPVIAEFKI